MTNLAKIIACVLFVITSHSNAAPITSENPEFKQLQAMGYDLENSTNNNWTIVSASGSKFVVSKNEERTIIFRMFTANNNINKEKKSEILEIINELNIDTSYQIALGDGYLTVALYNFGPYDSKTFAKLVRLIEKANTIFDTKPNLIQLIK